ncbi:MAG TPA: antibiotic biosynthesis monooxygenase [Chloroflexia bacterium]
MIFTLLEAHVAADQWQTLQHAYEAGLDRLPPQMVQTFLMQDARDPTRWSILSFWHSREALDEYRQTAGTPEGILWFRAAGAEPTLAAGNVVAQAAQ